MEVLFRKTPKGREEIETRAGGLKPALRRVLIYADGKRTEEDFRTLPGIDDLQSVLKTLEQEGYIEPCGLTTVSPTATPARDNGPFRPLPALANPLQLQAARNFMINTLVTFVGTFGVSGLVKRLEQSQNHADLRGLFEEWRQTLMTSREGRRELDKLQPRLLEII